MFHELRNTRDPNIISLTTSLYTIVSSIGHAYGQLFDIFEYKPRIRDYYSNRISKEQVKNLHI
jgi:hypothetical protein